MSGQLGNEEAKNHWNHIYENKEISKLGWYQERSEPSLKLMEKIDLAKNDRILIVGAGATELVDSLVDLQYTDITANDLSEVGLSKIEQRLGVNGQSVTFIQDDLTESKYLVDIDPIALWHDRAVLHFFTEKNQRDAYVKLINKLVKVDGYVIIAAFSLNSAQKCSGLDVHRYSAQMLEELLGDDFKLLESFDYLYIMPNGSERPYIYTIFKRFR